MSSTFTRDLPMKQGTSGSKTFSVPSQYKFMSIINATVNSIDVYEGQVSDADPQSVAYTVPIQTAITYPLDKAPQLTFFYQDGGAGKDVKASIIFSTDNLGINGALGGSVQAQVGIASDNVGLARQSQLPASLAASGSLKVDVTTAQVHTVVDSMPTITTTDNGRMTASPKTAHISLSAGTATPARVGGSDLANRKSIAIVNLDTAATVYVGGSDVTTGNGFPIPPGGNWAVDQNPDYTAPVYVVCASAVSVAVMEVS